MLRRDPKSVVVRLILSHGHVLRVPHAFRYVIGRQLSSLVAVDCDLYGVHRTERAMKNVIGDPNNACYWPKPSLAQTAIIAQYGRHWPVADRPPLCPADQT